MVAVNVVKLKTDNIDPRRYFGRLEAWQKRVKAAGATEWRVINDLERLDADPRQALTQNERPRRR